MSVELISCPFCGGEATSAYDPESKNWPERHGCEACWVFMHTPEDWNRRASPAPTARRGPPQERRGPAEREQAGRTLTRPNAGSVVLRFGKYKGNSIEEIASTAAGKSYFAWLLEQDYLKPDTREDIETFLGDASQDQRRGDEDPAY